MTWEFIKKNKMLQYLCSSIFHYNLEVMFLIDTKTENDLHDHDVYE